MLALNEASGIDAEDDQGLPRAMICPITTRWMRDPAITSEGQSYELRAILNWLKHNNTDPITRSACEKKVYLNDNLRRLIRERLDIKEPYELDTEAVEFQKAILAAEIPWESYYYFDLFSEEAEPTDTEQSAQASPPPHRWSGIAIPTLPALLGAWPTAQQSHCSTYRGASSHSPLMRMCLG